MHEALGFPHAWMFVADDDNPDEVRLLDASSGVHDMIYRGRDDAGDPRADLRALLQHQAPDRALRVRARLAVAYGIVRQHHGLLHCYSEPGAGTSFKIYLPVGGPVQEPPAHRPREAARGGAERILLAEDDAPVREAVGRVLGAAGYQIELAADGASAVELARASAFDVVILDVAMPHLGGPAALRQIRELRPGARFLLSSGYLGDAAAVAAREARPDGLLQKPYDPEALLGRIRELLDGPPEGA